jgi:hypothetical protein
MNIRKLILLFLSLLFAVLLAEGALRIFFKSFDKDIDVYRNFSFERTAKTFMPDEILSYRLIPNVCRNAFTSDFQVIYCTNTLGLREKELENTDKFKILFLGDSQTFGEGVPLGFRFSDLIEKKMPSVYSINAGVPGYGIHQMNLWLKYSGLSLKPNLVICSIISPDLNRVLYKDLKKSPYLLTRKRDEKAVRCGAAQWGNSFLKKRIYY